MATDTDFIAYVADQAAGAGEITYRKMFGEYALYLDGKVVALVCDNRLFVKPTSGGRAILGTPVEAPPYPKARPHFLIEEGLDDRKLMTRLLSATAAELPSRKEPRPRVRRRAG